VLETVLSMALPTANTAGKAYREPRDAGLIRVRPDELKLLAEHAGRRGLASATYVPVLVRSHLRHLAPLPKVELVAEALGGGTGSHWPNPRQGMLRTHTDVLVSVGAPKADLSDRCVADSICCHSHSASHPASTGGPCSRRVL
jgi:hypothetical protein